MTRTQLFAMTLGITGSAAVDRGVALPTVTDGFSGRAPDLGALEAGAQPPLYGPRPISR